MSEEKYVLKADEGLGRFTFDGYYTGGSYIYQGCRYAVVNRDITKAKVYSSHARAVKASEMSFENYNFKVEKLKD